jgi:hypothetical protein
MNDPLNQKPPDNTGTDTLSRFRYQAQLALPFCLECARQEKVRSVIMEHFEDIVLEYKDYWQFIQVKSRNPDQGDWNFSRTLEALKSLYRAFQNISGIKARYSLFLEGNLSASNELKVLINFKPDIPNSLLEKVAEEIGISESESEVFLKVVTIHPGQINRDHITAHNTHLMGQISPHTSAGEIEALEQKLTDEILRAMSADRLSDLLCDYISRANLLNDADKNRVKSKQITSEKVINLLGSFTSGSYPLLTRITNLDLPTPSNLEKKLIAVGAADSIIRVARARRADASYREYEILSSGFWDAKKFDDVQERLETLAVGVIEECKDLGKPASSIWRELLKELTQQAAYIDPNRIYKQDPHTLIGAVCGISDECRIDWGVKIA